MTTTPEKNAILYVRKHRPNDLLRIAEAVYSLFHASVVAFGKVTTDTPYWPGCGLERSEAVLADVETYLNGGDDRFASLSYANTGVVPAHRVPKSIFCEVARSVQARIAKEDPPVYVVIMHADGRQTRIDDPAMVTLCRGVKGIATTDAVDVNFRPRDGRDTGL